MNNKGFAITTILYGILILFLMLLVSMLGILSTYKDRLGMLIDNNNGARDIINGKSNTDTADLYVDGKSGSFEITPNSNKNFSSAKLKITWKEKYNKHKNASIVYITNFELCSSADIGHTWVGGGKNETKGLYINNVLVQEMSYFKGGTKFPAITIGSDNSDEVCASLAEMPTSLPWNSEELIHDADGTLAVPIEFDGRVITGTETNYADFNNASTSVTLTDTKE